MAISPLRLLVWFNMFALVKKLLSSFSRSNKGICSICNLQFEDESLTLIDSLSLCKQDYALYCNSNWIDFKTVKSDPEKPENALMIQDLKDLLTRNHIPSYIKCTYSQEANGKIISTFILFIPENLEEKAFSFHS